MKTLRVVQVSESEFSVQGHGVHTAFCETVHGLQNAGAEVINNSLFTPADIRHIHTVGPYSLAHLLVGSGKKIVSAHIVPESLVGSLIGASWWLPVARAYLRWFYNRADTVIAVSDETKDVLKRLGVKRPIEVVYNMIDTSVYQSTPKERQALRDKLGYGGKDVIVVSNGQVQPRKRVDLFLQMAASLPSVKFIWVGGLPFGKVAADASKMQQLIDQAPENVTFTGVVSLPEVRDYFAISDIFVFPSDQETFGLAVVEAAASGLPVVLRDISDYDNTFRPDAVMVHEDAFVSAIERLIRDKTHYRAMQQRANKLAQRYDSATVVRHLLRVYESTI